MSFGTDLSFEFERLTKGGTYSETELVTKLQDSFFNLKHHCGYGGVIDIIHGARSYVNFYYDGRYTRNPTLIGTVMRELADMMFIMFSRSEIRLMYLQNKVGKLSSSKSDYSFKMDLLQYYLLSERTVLSGGKLPGCVFGNRNILSGALYPSVASYGVFYETGSKTDMLYSPACNISPLKSIGYSEERTGFVNFSKVSASGLKRGRAECQFRHSLDGFGDSLISMTIGTPLCYHRAVIRNVVDFLNARSEIFYNSGYAQRNSYYEYAQQDNGGDDNNLPGYESFDIFASVPVTYVIRVDET